MGPLGTGKTLLMNLISDMGKLKDEHQHYFPIYHVDFINFCFQREGVVGINRFIENYDSDMRSRPQKNICIDELGKENQKVAHYSNNDDVIAMILNGRHRIREQGVRTHATTNKDDKMLLERYTEHLFDRFKEMFVMIAMDGKSRRK